MKAIKIIGVFTLVLMSNVVIGQDTMYVVEATGKISTFEVSNIDSVVFTAPANISNQLTDLDNNTYKTVTIGTQVWMAENLRTTKYNDGTSIPNEADNVHWPKLTTGAWCYYEGIAGLQNTYGMLYNGFAVRTDKLCPTGWHVPSDSTWTVLTDYLAANGHIGTEGTVLKTTSGWSSSGNGTDVYAWNGVPSGVRRNDGIFYNAGNNGYWWSSTHYYSQELWGRSLDSSNDIVTRKADFNNFGNSVRCLKD
jgi:uncharacterized protein (TIGR02145 family)